MIGKTNTSRGIGAYPKYMYTSSSEFIDEGNGNWRIKFYNTGFLTFQSLLTNIDVFLVGGGGGGSAGGGAGGYTNTYTNINIKSGIDYYIIIGQGGAGNNDSTRAATGGTTYAFGKSANGGQGGDGGSGRGVGGNGGSGGGGWPNGAGGTDGGNGVNSSYNGGTGQGTTTREFGETTGTLYASGAKGNTAGSNPPKPNPNTGDGGETNTSGASGIVVIRNRR